MKKEDELLRDLTEMIKDTQKGALKWKVTAQTTEYNDESQKPKVTEEGVEWTVDECYVSYYCKYQGEEFLMITYEMTPIAMPSEMLYIRGIASRQR